jgi:hypothetical protein
MADGGDYGMSSRCQGKTHFVMTFRAHRDGVSCVVRFTGKLLWPAITAVAKVLMFSPQRLSYGEVAAIATAVTQSLA